MAIDSAFMLEFLHVIYSMRDEKKRKEDSNKPTGSLAFTSVEILTAESTSIEVLTEKNTLPAFTEVTHIFYGRSRPAHNTIVRDMVMLENQIPLFLLRKMPQYRFLTLEELAKNMLYKMLKGFRKKFCPFKSIKDLEEAAVSRCEHLLDYMHRTILPEPDDEQTSDHDGKTEDQGDKNKIAISQSASQVTKLLLKTKEWLGRVSVPKKLKPVKVVVNVVNVAIPKSKGEGLSLRSDGDSKKPPEIKIPSATELARAGVRFSALTDGARFRTMSFDAKRARLHLPTIKVNENTEVILRNLVAYEASRHRSLYFTRYTELMNGIIDTAEDVRLLKKNNIIKNHLKSDEEAANMWNGMSRSIKKKKVPELDEVIKSVNKYYDSRWMIKAETFMRIYVYESWMFLSFMAAVLLLLIELFESFCSVYDCNKLLHLK